MKIDKKNPDTMTTIRMTEHMIAAAPELLAALIGMADLYDTDDGCRTLPQYVAARAAIDNATGEHHEQT